MCHFSAKIDEKSSKKAKKCHFFSFLAIFSNFPGGGPGKLKKRKNPKPRNHDFDQKLPEVYAKMAIFGVFDHFLTILAIFDHFHPFLRVLRQKVRQISKILMS